MNELTVNPIIIVLWIASLVQVGIQSVKYKRVGRPFWHMALVGLVIWPVGYLLWVFYWPGLFVKSKDQLASEAWVETLFTRRHAAKQGLALTRQRSHK